MKPIWKILIAVAVVVVIVAALFVVPHYRAKWKVNAYREQLKRQGEKMSIAELAPFTTAEEVSNGKELTSAAMMARYFTNSPPMMRWLAPGHVMVSSQETNSVTDSTTNCWPEFSAVIERSPEIAERLAAALQKPGIAFAVDYQQGFGAPLTYLANIKRAAIWLWGGTMLALHEGDTSNAWSNLKMETDLIRLDRGEPFMISQLVRAASMQVALAATWEALQNRGWDDGQLAQLQTNWNSFDMMDKLEPCLSMERAMQRKAFNELRESYTNFNYLGATLKNDHGGYESIGEVLVNPSEGIPAYLGRRPRYWMWKWWGSYDEELYAIQVAQAALEAMRKARAEDAFVPALENFHQAVTNLQASHPGWDKRFVFADSVADITSNTMLRTADAETERRMVVTAIALSRYRLRHGEYPARLEELMPDYLAKMPIDFMDGKPLRYQRKPDGTFLVYSVGEDGKDNGGVSAPLPSDTSVHKAWYKMQDAVWPMPATPEEVAKYETEMLQKQPKKPIVKPVPKVVIPKPAAANSKTN